MINYKLTGSFIICKVLFSKNSDDWRTPAHIYDLFMKLGYVDPCPFQCPTNNLETDMGGGKFINIIILFKSAELFLNISSFHAFSAF